MLSFSTDTFVLHDIIYEGTLYNDIDKCLSSGDYEICAI